MLTWVPFMACELWCRTVSPAVCCPSIPFRSLIMPGLGRDRVRFGWTMWHALAQSQAYLSVLPSNGTTATVSTGRMQESYAPVSEGVQVWGGV